MYFVYVLKSQKDQSTYIGKTRNVEKRLREHNSGLTSSTKNSKPFDIVSFFAFRERHRTDDFERYLKSASGRAFLNKRVI